MRILIHDNGLNTELAVALARAGHSVGFHTPWQSAFPKASQAFIGHGLEGLEPVADFTKALEKCDLLFCPDTFTAEWVSQARAMKKPVWGAGDAEVLEQDRALMKSIQKKIGLAVGPYVEILGIDALIRHLQTTKNRWIKASKWRQIETFKHIDWPSTRDQYLGPILEAYSACGDEISFISEEPLDSVCEVGIDGVFDHSWLMPFGWGYEAKDEAYIGTVGELPKPLQAFTSALAPELKSRRCTSFVSNEVIFTKDGKAYQIEPTIRAPHPPMAGMLELYKNLPAVITDEEHTLKPNTQYVAVLVVRSSWAGDHWLKIEFPPQMRRNVKLSQACRFGGNYYAVPGNEFVAYAVGTGSTIANAVLQCKKVAESIRCRDMDVNASALDRIAEEQIPNGKKFGIMF